MDGLDVRPIQRPCALLLLVVQCKYCPSPELHNIVSDPCNYELLITDWNLLLALQSCSPHAEFLRWGRFPNDRCSGNGISNTERTELIETKCRNEGVDADEAKAIALPFYWKRQMIEHHPVILLVRECSQHRHILLGCA